VRTEVARLSSKVIAINLEHGGIIKVLANQLMNWFDQVHGGQAIPDFGKSMPLDYFV
jgi:hypothetical protein